MEASIVPEPRSAAFELAGAGLVITDPAGSIVRANRMYAEMVGERIDTLIGAPFDAAFPAASRQVARHALRAALAPDSLPMPSHWTLERRDGRRVSVLLMVRPVAAPHGRSGAVITVIDVTAMLETEARLSAVIAEERLILDNAQVGILFTRDGKIMRYNAACGTMLGYGDIDLVGQPAAALFTSQDEFDWFTQRFFPALGRGEAIHTECRVKRRDGPPLLCRVAGRAIEPGDLAQGLIWILQDVSAERAAQAALERARDELERRVELRTRDLAAKNVELQAEITERRLIEERLRARNERLAVHRNRLLALAQRDHPDFTAALTDIAAVAMSTLRLDRVTFWRMNAERDRMQCELTLRPDGATAADTTPHVLEAAKHEAHFRAITGHRVVAASDAASDPATASLGPGYLAPLGIRALLDASIWLDGRVVGKISLEALRGAREWLPEDADFASGIAGMVALALEAEQRREAERKLRHLAHYDGLTGLPNRNLLQDRLRQALAHARRHRKRVALMFLDLDRFKTINDSLGHLIGDRLLQQVAQRLTGKLRGEDTVARLGGDEFVVVLQGIDNAGDAAVVAQNLLEAVEPPYLVDGRELHVSASIGITLFPDDGQDVETLMRNADTAMYHVKDGGRNGLQFFAETMNAQANSRLTLENQLRQALRRGEFTLHYQPQIDIASQRVRAFEALLRWRHPERGLVLPGEFIGVAEDTGLIQALGEWTLAEACAQSRRWSELGMARLPIAVNLSARQFRNRDLAGTLREILADAQMDPALLELEITESALMQHSESTETTLAALRDMGIRLAIDDFGIGYSSLAYLKRFPIDKLKIDGSFVRDLPHDADDTAITSAIISMSKNLKLRVVAEGVETQAQLDFLRSRGCDDAQGYLLCKPVPAGEAARLVMPQVEVAGAAP